ncbi:MAG: MFS transporter [Bacteroidales bacterium]|jgi:FSR family fosmidomycin resistance protein-like MFS transporter|nr:MFS transporter [Bacteroidales bacterium]
MNLHVLPKSLFKGFGHLNKGGTAFGVLLALSFSHLSNDTLQSLIPSLYPILKESLALNFSQIGLITLTFQLSSSLLQPVIGHFTDRHPQPWSLPVGMGFSLVGLFCLAFSSHYYTTLLAVSLTGIGSSIFHPEASKVAFMASGGRRGTAQSIFQVGGNFGSSLGPLLAALIIVPAGQRSILCFSILALVCILVMNKISRWYKSHLHLLAQRPQTEHAPDTLSRRKVFFPLVILLLLIFSKYVYLASIHNYYTFYLMHKFDVSVQMAQVFLFVFLFSVAAGTFIGGPLGDKIGRKYVIWISILGVAPFTLIMPHVGLTLTVIFSMLTGVILSSAFSAILVYAQELMPGKVGMIAGLFFGFAFGIAGVGSAVLGKVADVSGIEFVYLICSFLPLIGLLTVFLPNIRIKHLTQA